MRRFSSWLTLLILLVAAIPLGVAGCGGGGGPAGSATSRDHFGQVTLRVVRHEGPPQARVVGDHVFLAASESTQRLVVEFYTLPLQESSSPLLVRGFDLGQGQTTAVIDQIPAPAWYQVRGYLYEGSLSDYTSSFVVEVEVLPGVVSTASATMTPNVPTLKRLELSPLNPAVAAGLGQQFQLTGVYSDESRRDLTSSATWSSSDDSVATVSNQTGSQGFASALKAGQASIQAEVGGLSASTPLQVTAARLVSLTVTPAVAEVPQGLTQQFTATGLFTDDSTQDLTDQVTWASSAPGTATVSNEAGTRGQAFGAAPGLATLTATEPGSQIQGQATLTVSPATLTALEITPLAPSIARGTSQQFTATGIFSDATTRDLTGEVRWTSSDPELATISDEAATKGLAAARAEGQATIRATDPTTGIVGTATLTITPARLIRLQVDPPTATVPKGLTRQFTATGTYTDDTTQDLTDQVTWSTSDQELATISNAAGTQGLASTWQTGQVEVRAIDLDTGIHATAALAVTPARLVRLQVDPPTATVPKGLTWQYTATGTYTDDTTRDLTDQVTWTSLQPTLASVSNEAATKGKATGLAEGLANLEATDPTTGIKATATLTVTAARLVRLQVDPPAATVPKGLTQDFTATGTYTDDTTQDLTGVVTWTSSEPTVATITNEVEAKGRATGLSEGQATLEATDPTTGIKATATLTITAARLMTLQVSPQVTVIPEGLTQQFAATGTFSDATTQDLTGVVTWMSSEPTIATITNGGTTKGMATGLSEGVTEIRATDAATGVIGETTLIVEPARLVTLAVTPADPTLPVGLTQQFTATGTYTNGAVVDLTGQVNWGSTDGAVASIANATGARGLAQALGAGVTWITAVEPTSDVKSQTQLTVTQAVLVSLTITPTNPMLDAGGTLQLHATGNYSDGTVQDLTEVVTWSSEFPSRISVSNATGSRGLVQALVSGTVTITATEPTSMVSTTTPVVAKDPDGTPKWNLEVSGSPIMSAPAIGLDGTLYMGSTDDHQVHAVDPVGGTIKWRFTTAGPVVRSPSIGPDGTVYVCSESDPVTDGGILYALDPTDGSLKWSMLQAGAGTPAVGADGTLYLSGLDATVKAIKPGATPQVLWTYNVGGAPLLTSPIGAADGTGYVWNNYGQLVAITYDEATGVAGEKWRAFLGTAGPPWQGQPALGADGTIYVQTGTSVVAVNPADGSKRWDSGVAPGNQGCVVGADGTIFAFSSDQNLYALNPDGSTKWTYASGTTAQDSPIVAQDGRVYLGAGNEVQAISPVGTLLWRQDLYQPVGGTVLGPDGTLYAATELGMLHAFYGSFAPATGAWPMSNRDPQHTGRQY